jgi:hypothetical protein
MCRAYTGHVLKIELSEGLAMTEKTLNGFSTLAIGEEGHTTTIIDEEDFRACAETEHKLHADDFTRKGGPFGAY